MVKRKNLFDYGESCTKSVGTRFRYLQRRRTQISVFFPPFPDNFDANNNITDYFKNVIPSHDRYGGRFIFDKYLIFIVFGARTSNRTDGREVSEIA